MQCEASEIPYIERKSFSISLQKKEKTGLLDILWTYTK